MGVQPLQVGCGDGWVAHPDGHFRVVALRLVVEVIATDHYNFGVDDHGFGVQFFRALVLPQFDAHALEPLFMQAVEQVVPSDVGTCFGIGEDSDVHTLLCHLFEGFSPASGRGEVGIFPDDGLLGGAQESDQGLGTAQVFLHGFHKHIAFAAEKIVVDEVDGVGEGGQPFQPIALGIELQGQQGGDLLSVFQKNPGCRRGLLLRHGRQIIRFPRQVWPVPDAVKMCPGFVARRIALDKGVAILEIEVFPDAEVFIFQVSPSHHQGIKIGQQYFIVQPVPEPAQVAADAEFSELYALLSEPRQLVSADFAGIGIHQHPHQYAALRRIGEQAQEAFSTFIVFDDVIRYQDLRFGLLNQVNPTLEGLCGVVDDAKTVGSDGSNRQQQQKKQGKAVVVGHTVRMGCGGRKYVLINQWFVRFQGYKVAGLWSNLALFMENTPFQWG